MRILFLGDIVGEPGRKAVIAKLPSLRKEYNLDFIIANGENSAAGRGITPKIAIDLLRAGIAVITSGDHIWDQRDIVSFLPNEPRLLRPINYPEGTPGNGSIVLETDKGKIAVFNAQGRTFMQPPLENPYTLLEKEIAKVRNAGVSMIFVDFHAETTSEAIAMGWHLDGLASAVVGTHTHVQTADEKILPEGCAHISDVGMCGPDRSILGRKVEPIVWKLKTGLPARFDVAKGAVRLCGVIIELDEETGKAVSIARYNQLLEENT